MDVGEKEALMRAFVRAVRVESEGCSRCRSTFNKAALEFHHRNPAEKVAAIGQIIRTPWKYKLTDLMNEIAKCDLVCTPCHKDIHRSWAAKTGKPNVNPDCLPKKKLA